jgi:hypothetical protein
MVLIVLNADISGRDSSVKTWGVDIAPKKERKLMFMRIKMIILAMISTLLLTSCSNSSSKPSYDELDLIKYKSCMDYYMAGLGRYGATYLLSEQYAQQAEDQCKSLRPVKK